MKNLEFLSSQELIATNGGYGQKPVIVIQSSTGPTYPDRPPFGDPSEWDTFGL